jgi:transposase
MQRCSPREIQAKGYRGGESIVRQRLRAWRQTPPASHVRLVVIAPPRTVRAWLVGLNNKYPEQAQENERFVAHPCNQNPQIAVARRLALHFIAMTRKEMPVQLDGWIRQARQCGVSVGIPAHIVTTHSGLS